MIDRAALARIAGLVGIEARYTDVFGETREASDETLLALISAFGLPPDPVEAAALFEESERAAPLGLGPVHLVHGEDTHPSLALRLPARTREIVWTCRLEDGDERSGRLAGQAGPVDMPLPGGLPLGYHRLAVEGGGSHAEIDLIVAPARCHLPPQLAQGARSWGLTCQLYGLRSAHDWGIGDFTDLAGIAAAAGSSGAAVLGINPLHARFAAEPLHFSPYSPSSRSWLDYLYIDATAVPGFAEDETVQTLVQGEWFGATRWAACSAELIDYGAVAACKRPVLEALYRRFQALDIAGAGEARTHLGQSFRRFQQDGGQSLADLAVFEALHEFYCRERRGFSWRSWPGPMRDPRSPEVGAFAAAHRERIEFFQFLQWQADRQLAAAAAAGRAGGLSIGLYRDFAVGADPNGADAWADQVLIAPDAAIGAPPDILSRAGQNWGLAPINPLVLRRQRFAPFIACLRANMRHAGVLRVDHVMSLNRLYWIPSGMEARDGCYVNYPFDALLRLVALESCRQGCAVVGEDLGTVPPGFRETLRAANVLSYRIMVFERRRDGTFISPGDYPPLAAASAATHDLATLQGFWLGRDIAWRRRLGLYPDANAEIAEAAERARDRRLLLDALVAEGLLGVDDRGQFLTEAGEPIYLAALGTAIQRYLARSHARLMLVQIEDLVGEAEQANLPGTSDEHPNWRRRLGHTLEEIIDGSELRRLAPLIEQERRRSATA
ncbi:MAG TPA: 4-alpha-glucanotransferase [Stellaceae bacterium]|nr:4-alpha-glucanotransferase [Stellaceae bacterium]